MSCYQHISYVRPKATLLVSWAPQCALGSEQINLQARHAEALQEPKLSQLCRCGGQGEGLSREGETS